MSVFIPASNLTDVFIVKSRILFVLVALVASVAVVVVMLLPPAAAQSSQRNWQDTWPVVSGVFHVHSQASDGTGTIDEIAAAAARAGLQFIVITDHGNGTRALMPAAYKSGVLVMEGVEISTQHGHYAAVGFFQSPYPLAGHPRDVIEDVRRLGGFGVATHPGSPKAALRWDDWEADFDALEWLNADSEWRDEFWTSLGRSLITYAFRPVESLAAVLDRPSDVIARWDRVARQRRVTGLAGADAHARLGWRQGTEPYVDREIARIPSYETSFEAFRNHVILDEPLSGDPAWDAILVLGAIRNGRVFTTIDGLAQFGGFEAKVTSGSNVARIGDYVDLAGAPAIEARMAAPDGTVLHVIRDGKTIHRATDAQLHLELGNQPGVYRLEAYLPTDLSADRVPWILTNPFYVGLKSEHDTHAAHMSREPPAPTERRPIATQNWQAEASRGSTSSLAKGAIADGTPALVWSFSLGSDAFGSSFAALRFPLSGTLAPDVRLQLRAAAGQHMRMWAQLRRATDREGERWGRTFYLEPQLRTIDLRFDEFRPLGPVSDDGWLQADSLLLVVDLLNSHPGAKGQITIPDIWIVR